MTLFIYIGGSVIFFCTIMVRLENNKYRMMLHEEVEVGLYKLSLNSKDMKLFDPKSVNPDVFISINNLENKVLNWTDYIFTGLSICFVFFILCSILNIIRNEYGSYGVWNELIKEKGLDKIESAEMADVWYRWVKVGYFEGADLDNMWQWYSQSPITRQEAYRSWLYHGLGIKTALRNIKYQEMRILEWETYDDHLFDIKDICNNFPPIWNEWPENRKIFEYKNEFDWGVGVEAIPEPWESWMNKSFTEDESNALLLYPPFRNLYSGEFPCFVYQYTAYGMTYEQCLAEAWTNEYYFLLYNGFLHNKVEAMSGEIIEQLLQIFVDGWE